MSHIVEIETEIRDLCALRAACLRLGLNEPVLETVRLFNGEATGFCVRLPDWHYPVAIDVEQGKILFDNFSERWGEKRELDRLVQAYAVEKTRLEAHHQGHTITEQPLDDGSIKLTIRIEEAS